MPSLHITITTGRMLRSTPFHRLVKAPERLHYLLLFSTDRAYLGKADPWRSWLQLGFSLALKDPPPDAVQADRLDHSVTSEGLRIAIAIEGRADMIGTVRSVLQRVEMLRPALKGASDEAKGARLLADAQVSKLVGQPVTQALARAGLRQDEAETLTGVLRGALAALANDDVTGVTVAG